MGSLERGLRVLEDDRKQEGASLSREALKHLSDEDLDALEDALEAGQGDGTAAFEDLYRASEERSRRALEAYFEAYEAARRGEEPRSPPAGRDYLDLIRRIEDGDEEARREWERRDGYRIWKYYKE